MLKVDVASADALIDALHCLGAPHARLILRSLLQALIARVATITVIEAKEHIEHEARYERANGYDSLTVRLTPLAR